MWMQRNRFVTVHIQLKILALITWSNTFSLSRAKIYSGLNLFWNPSWKLLFIQYIKIKSTKNCNSHAGYIIRFLFYLSHVTQGSCKSSPSEIQVWQLEEHVLHNKLMIQRRRPLWALTMTGTKLRLCPHANCGCPKTKTNR